MTKERNPVGRTVSDRHDIVGVGSNEQALQLGLVCVSPLHLARSEVQTGWIRVTNQTRQIACRGSDTPGEDVVGG
jgi:hypothetical protein